MKAVTAAVCNSCGNGMGGPKCGTCRFFETAKIAMVSELGYVGKIRKDEKNLRIEITLARALNVDMIPWGTKRLPDVLSKYDIVFMIIPKSNPVVLQMLPSIQGPAKILLQEGPGDWYMNWEMQWQYWYLRSLKYFQAIFTHNDLDQFTFEGLCDVPVYVCPSTIDLKAIEHIVPKQEEKVMIGGNCVSGWYNGTNSVMACQDLDIPIYLPTMGKRYEKEAEWLSNIVDVKQIPYMNWTNFMEQLSTYKYAVHLMPIIAANSFSLNCAALGIPCVGNIDADIHRDVFPNTSIDYRDVVKARKMMKDLQSDKTFYKEVQDYAKERVKYYDINNSFGVMSGIKNNIYKVFENAKSKD